MTHYQKSYGKWSGKPNGNRPDFTKCAASVHPPGMWSIERQCSRSCGHGPDGAYCKTHAKKIEARNDS